MLDRYVKLVLACIHYAKDLFNGRCREEDRRIASDSSDMD